MSRTEKRLKDYPPLTLREAARVLGIPFSELRADIAAGAGRALLPDGRISLAEYALWCRDTWSFFFAAGDD